MFIRNELRAVSCELRASSFELPATSGERIHVITFFEEELVAGGSELAASSRIKHQRHDEH
jgi:hypothetical protein